MDIKESELECLLHHLSEVDSLLRFIIRRERVKQYYNYNHDNDVDEQERISEAYNK